MVMNTFLYIVAILLVIGWILGFFAFHAGDLIHGLLVLAIIAILIRIIKGKNPL